MAESILGLLFVTSSSSGRNIFRYPPDPKSPSPRLARPFYPSATYTAKDATVDARRPRRLFPKRRLRGTSGGLSDLGPDSRGSSRGGGTGLGLYAGPVPTAASASGGVGGSSRVSRANASGASGSDGRLSEDESASESSSSSSDDDGDDGLWRDGGGGGTGGVGGGTARYADDTPRPSIVEAWDRRPSVADSEATTRRATPTPGDRERARAERERDQGRERAGDAPAPAERANRSGPAGAARRDDDDDRFAEDQYQHALGYSLDFLSDLLTPPRAACNRMFEVCVDELVFVGHPVAIGRDGWGFPADDEGSDDEARGGRTRGRRGREAREGNGRERELRTVVEHDREASGSSAGRSSGVGGGSNGAASTSTPSRGDDEPPLLNAFHLVLVFDKPDPESTDAAAEGRGAVGMYDEAYYEIAFKWTAAAFALQVRDNWVGREADRIARVRDQAMAEGVPLFQSVQTSVSASPLARSLHALFNALDRGRRHARHSIFSRLPTTFTVDVADIPVQVVLSPPAAGSGGLAVGPAGQHADARAGHDGSGGLGGLGGADDSDSDDELDWRAGALVDPAAALLAKQAGALRVEPWHTLLLLDGAEAGGDDGASDDGAALVMRPTGRDLASRRGSKATIQDEDEKLLMDALVAACDVTKPLAEIAHVLRFDLEGIVIPLARDLVQARRAILIDVVNTRLRTMIVPAPLDAHMDDLPRLVPEFARLFPALPPLLPFLSHVSAAPGPIRDLLPSAPPPGVRETYLRALIWTLARGLAVQTHTRARLVARAAVKRDAWVRLWRRRREKWMRRRSAASSDREALGADAHGHGLSHGHGHGHGGMLAGSLAASLRLSSTYEQAYDQMMAYDPDLEADSDVEDDWAVAAAAAAAGLPAGTSATSAASAVTATHAGSNGHVPVPFSADVADPPAASIPAFASGFIVRPARAQKDEMRWIRVIREGAQDAVMASQFDLCVQYFDGVTTFEEIIYRTGLAHRELEQITQVFKDDVRVLTA